MSDYTLIPYYSLQPDRLTVYQRPEGVPFSEKQKDTFKNLENNQNKYNELSSHSRKRLQKSLSYMLYISQEKSINGQELKSKTLKTEIEVVKGRKYKKKKKYKITFITLTLSAKQHNTDEEIKSKLLGSFLDALRRKWKVDMYIWKAEKQENGNIHFHILTNKYIHWEEIRQQWNKIQNKKGFEYVNLYRSNMQKHFKNGFKPFKNDKRSIEKQQEVYETNKKENFSNPNSTDIHALYKIKNIASYMSKYMSKEVTKTTRVSEMENIYTRLKQIQIQLETYKFENAFFLEKDKFDFSDEPDIFSFDNTAQDTYKQSNDLKILDLEIEQKNLTEKLEKLKAKGVSGRIWGQSQTLSKIKNFTEVESFTDIPDIEKVEKFARYKNEFDVGSSKVLTYYFDMKKTPKLKSLLDTHINQILFDKLL